MAHEAQGSCQAQAQGLCEDALLRVRIQVVVRLWTAVRVSGMAEVRVGVMVATNYKPGLSACATSYRWLCPGLGLGLPTPLKSQLVDLPPILGVAF